MLNITDSHRDREIMVFENLNLGSTCCPREYVLSELLLESIIASAGLTVRAYIKACNSAKAGSKDAGDSEGSLS